MTKLEDALIVTRLERTPTKGKSFLLQWVRETLSKLILCSRTKLLLRLSQPKLQLFGKPYQLAGVLRFISQNLGIGSGSFICR